MDEVPSKTIADVGKEPDKAALRSQLLNSLKNLSSDQILTLSQQACERMTKQAIWQNARIVLGYAPMGLELDIWPLLVQGRAEGKKIALLRFETKRREYMACQLDEMTDVVKGQFGIRE